MKLNAGEHCMVVGTTGAGKTYFAKNALLPVYPRIIVVDTEDYDFEEFPVVSVKKAVRLAQSDTPIFFCRVVLSGVLSRDIDSINSLCYGLLAHGHDVVVYFDEVTDYSDAHHIPDSLRALVRKGRRRPITVMVGSQRPAMISKDFWGNTLHKWIFALSDYDIEAVRPYAPRVADHKADIAYGSHCSLYLGPDPATVRVVGPATRFHWERRKTKK